MLSHSTDDAGRSLGRPEVVPALGHGGDIRCTPSLDHLVWGGIVGSVMHAETGDIGAESAIVSDGALAPRCACRELAGRPRISLWRVDSIITECDR